VLLLLVALHLVALRQVGSNNPDGIEIKEKRGADGKPLDGIPFHPYYTVKDVVGIGVFLTLFAIVAFFVPTFGNLFMEEANFEPANPLSTPEPIAPSWYFTPYYAILRAVPNQRLGALLLLIAVMAFFFLPWLDRSPVKSVRYRGLLFKGFLALFTVSFLTLMYLGLKPATGAYVTAARVAAIGYFSFFLLMPWYSRADRTKPVPERVRFHA
jgi:ubiquinol-cytochrome c reductase cytochrome b subunit